MARPSDYNLEIAAEICERLAGGEPLQAICRKGDGMPTDTIVRRWRYALQSFVPCTRTRARKQATPGQNAPWQWQ
jgi:hypothetical protein